MNSLVRYEFHSKIIFHGSRRFGYCLPRRKSILLNNGDVLI